MDRRPVTMLGAMLTVQVVARELDQPWTYDEDASALDPWTIKLRAVVTIGTLRYDSSRLASVDVTGTVSALDVLAAEWSLVRREVLAAVESSVM
jgi:hypothetical protein